jgi:hypothetical protein
MSVPTRRSNATCRSRRSRSSLCTPPSRNEVNATVSPATTRSRWPADAQPPREPIGSPDNVLRAGDAASGSASAPPTKTSGRDALRSACCRARCRPVSRSTRLREHRCIASCATPTATPNSCQDETSHDRRFGRQTPAPARCRRHSRMTCRAAKRPPSDSATQDDVQMDSAGGRGHSYPARLSRRDGPRTTQALTGRRLRSAWKPRRRVGVRACN